MLQCFLGLVLGPHAVLSSPHQVGDYTLEELQQLRWPAGERVLMVHEAVRLTSPFVDVVTLDVKTYQDKVGGGLGGGLGGGWEGGWEGNVLWAEAASSADVDAVSDIDAAARIWEMLGQVGGAASLLGARLCVGHVRRSPGQPCLYSLLRTAAPHFSLGWLTGCVVCLDLNAGRPADG